MTQQVDIIRVHRRSATKSASWLLYEELGRIRKLGRRIISMVACAPSESHEDFLVISEPDAGVVHMNVPRVLDTARKLFKRMQAGTITAEQAWAELQDSI